MNRIVLKGNINTQNHSYDIRITEEDGKEYYYHVLVLEEGESILSSKKPFNIKKASEIEWKSLPEILKDTHYHRAYPNGLADSYEKNCFLYGNEEADEIERIAEERQREEERLRKKMDEIAYKARIYPSTVLERIYNELGEFDEIKELSGKGNWNEYLVDNKWIVKTYRFRVESVIEKAENDKNRQNWGRRVLEISKAAKTSYNLATVVGDISDKKEAIRVLKKISKMVKSEEFRKAILPWIHGFYIKNFLIDHLSEEDHIKELHWSQRFVEEVEKILKKQK